VDFWGTLLLDGPRSDDRYRRVRLGDFERILADAGVTLSRPALEHGYHQSGAYLTSIWRTHRDVPVLEHVRTILAAAEAGLPGRLAPAVMARLAEAYARPALLVPPTVDPSAQTVLEGLKAHGYTLALISNTMRTPGDTLRKLLAHYRLLTCFAHTTFSDEVGIRKPDPEIFALTLRAVGGEPSSTVHVGDDEVLDVAGARGAGLQVIQVRSASQRGGAVRPDAVISGMAALPAAIARLEGA
jgi:putative hydrolase of the HAD superfamily